MGTTESSRCLFEQSQLCENLKSPENFNQTVKSSCFCRKQLFQRKRYPSIYENFYNTMSPWWLLKTLFTRRTSATKSPSYFLYVFIVWTLVIAPVLTDLIRSSLLFRHRILLGGITLTAACHPGSTNGGGTRPRPAVDLTPFQRNEYIPKMSEQTIGASGPAEGAIHRDTKRFNDELFPNWNPDIVFRDEEQTNEDRMMTKRCMDRLNELAIWVANQWPGVKLRVTEGWDNPDTQRIHPETSLHYEGRAVDITTTDQDETKYPILARLAVEAGFDWVYYEQSHVHCSVKSDSSEAALRGGCFPGDAMVPIPGGATKQMQDLRSGDKVFSVDANGKVISDTLLTFMDIQTDVYHGKIADRAFVSLTTDEGQTLRLTSNHLVYVSSQDCTFNIQRQVYNKALKFYRHTPSPTAVFAGNVKVGQYIHVTPSSRLLNHSFTATVRPVKVTNVDVVTSATGAYAPLTIHGAIVVGEALASCYAVIESDSVAHFVMSPTRWYHMLRLWLASHFNTELKPGVGLGLNETKNKLLPVEEGISFYSKTLYHFSYNFIPASMFWKD